MPAKLTGTQLSQQPFITLSRNSISASVFTLLARTRRKKEYSVAAGSLLPQCPNNKESRWGGGGRMRDMSPPRREHFGNKEIKLE